METKSTNIQGCICAFENAQTIMKNATDALLKEAFANREEYKIPDVLWQALQFHTPVSVWVDYKHDGSNIAVLGVRYKKDECHGSTHCLVSGIEINEYYQEDVENMLTYDDRGCAEFIQWYIEENWDSMLNNLAEVVNNEVDECGALEALEQWTEHYDINIDLDEVNIGYLMGWAKGYTPIK